MSDAVHLLVPFATCSAQSCAETLRGLRLPHLRRLMRRLAPQAQDLGHADDFSVPHERVLARAHGLPATDGLIPLAALQAIQSGAGEPGQGWAWISPGHWRVGSDHVAMANPQDLQLDGDDSRALLAAMRPYFEEDGIALVYDAPLRWLARGDVFRALPTASLDRVVGQRIDTWLPAGEAGRTLRRLQQEMQMLLYTLPLNDARQRGGLLPVNSFWVSGTGAFPAGHAPAPAGGLQVSPYLRDAALLGDWKGWAAAWQRLDARDCTRLLGELERGRTVRLTLCGETGSRTWGSAGAGTWQRLRNWLAPAAPAALMEGL